MTEEIKNRLIELANKYEVSRFLRQRLKPCPRKEGFKGRKTAGFGL